MMKTNLKTRGQRGAAMIEFALVLPVLLIVLLGTVEFSLLLYNKAMITNASREGARLGIVYRPGGGLTHPICGDIGTRAQQYAQNHLITFADPNPGPIINSCIYAKTADPTGPCSADCDGFDDQGLPGQLHPGPTYRKYQVSCWFPHRIQSGRGFFQIFPDTRRIHPTGVE